MILLDAKSKTNSSSPLNLSVSDEKTTLSFSELLSGASDKKGDKTIQNGSLLLSLEGDEKETLSTKKTKKSDTLLSLLKNEDKLSLDEPLELNPKLVQTLTTKELKTLIHDAKEYLKAKILNSEGYKKAEVKELPKTLKGLEMLARKFDLDVSKITVEEVRLSKKDIFSLKSDVQEHLPKHTKALTSKDGKEQESNARESKTFISTDVKDQVSKHHSAKELLKPDTKGHEVRPHSISTVTEKVTSENSKEIKDPLSSDTKKSELKPHDLKTLLSADIKSDKVKQAVSYKQSKEELQSSDGVKKENKVKVDLKSVPKEDLPKAKNIKNEDLNDELEIAKNNNKRDDKADELRREDRAVNMTKKTAPILLFKTPVQSEHTTQQLVQTKQFRVEEKTPKSRADETLKLLLMGEKASKAEPSLTNDFSVATARVIASAPTKDTTLINRDNALEAEDTGFVKTEMQGVHKADSFEVKLNEAKQMIKYLSSDVKSAIDDYKSPFTRVKVQLNPQKLGEVDLTVVQRGKNLHVNISSNNAAINTLLLNANDLRLQLNNNGINNATLNFNNQSDGSNSGSQQQQQHHHEKEAHAEYNYYNEEENEEVLSSLEIIVPQYI